MSKLSALLQVIGIFVLSSILIAIPLLTAFSFAYNWLGGVKFFLSVATFFEFCGLIFFINKECLKED